MASDKPTFHLQDYPKSGPIDSSTDISKIMDEFHCLYNEKLRNLDMSGEGSDEQKVRTLEEWVRDLTDQNRMLIKTVEHLEKNAIDRVDTLDCVLKARAAETQKPPDCKNCPTINGRLDLLTAELESAKLKIREKECIYQECLRQNDEMRKTLCSQSVASHAAKKSMECNNVELERAVVELKSQLCKSEKLLIARTEELECLKHKLIERERMNQMLKAESDKVRCLPKMQETIGLLKDEIKEKDCMMESYYQEINFLKEKLRKMDLEACKLIQLEDALKYCQQSLKQKDLMLEKLKDHIKGLNIRISQLQCQQDRGIINRSSSSEEPHSAGEMIVCDSFYCDEAIMAGGDSIMIDELKKKLANEKDMQIALTSEIAEKHDAIMRLKENVKELEEQLRQSDMQTHFKDDIIRQLRKEVKLGRAKESLAEMLGLKGGPRAQMKAKIDNLHSELEEREIEISRLEGKLEASRLPTVEAKLTRLEVELVDRDRSVLALCDKLEYVRKYLSRLRGSEEDISVKCGLEALLLELSEDVEWTRETRRNVSVPLNEDVKESVIIINHRSHSLPDTTLQKQVQSFKTSPENAGICECDSQTLKETSESLSLKEQITSLESNLCDTLSQLSTIWESMKKCEIECGDYVSRLTQEVQGTIETEHSQLLQVNSEMNCIAEKISELNELGTNNDYLLHCMEKCLTESMEMLGKQKMLMGFTESSSGSVIGDSNIPPNLKYISRVESNLGDSVSLLQQLKSKLFTWNESKSDLSTNRTKEIHNRVNNIIASKQNVLDKLYLVLLSQDEITKRIFKKFPDFDKTFTMHQDVAKGLKFLLNNFIFNDFVSKNSKQNIIALRSSDGKIEGNLPTNEPNVLALESGDNQTKRINSLRKNRLSRSSPSIGEEYHCDALGDVHIKSAHLQQIALALNEEIKSYLKEVFLREDKVRRFVCESQDLNKTLDNLRKELCSSEKILIENKSTFPTQTLQTAVGQVQSEIELLLCKTDDFTNYKEMYDMNRSKMEQEIQGLQKDLFTIVSDIMDAIKASQEYDSNILASYRNKIQNYREKVEQLEKHLTNSIDQNEVEEKEEEEEDLICRLTDKIEKYQSEVEKLRNSITVVKKDKEAVEIENQKVMEELQAKIRNR